MTYDAELTATPDGRFHVAVYRVTGGTRALVRACPMALPYSSAARWGIDVARDDNGRQSEPEVRVLVPSTERERAWWAFLVWLIATGRLTVGMREGAETMMEVV